MFELSPDLAADPVLVGLSEDFIETTGPDLLSRWELHHHFWASRLAVGLDPYTRSATDRIGPTAAVMTRDQQPLSGVNFASQDYLSLASHPVVLGAAANAIQQWGVHSAGSIALQGGSKPLTLLEERLAEFLSCREVTIFPTGWAAGYGVIRALVRESDHIVIDIVAHSCLREGAAASTTNIHRVPNCSNTAIGQHLARIRARDAQTGILVVTESLFSMDSTVPNLLELQQLCRQYKATLLVDVAHDLGAIGDGGLGFLGEQGLAGEVDVVMGAFSKTFASNGGFVASNAVGLKMALRTMSSPLLFSNALSPVQAATIGAALGIVRSREGAERRARLMRNIRHLRSALSARAFHVSGQPSAIVPVDISGLGQARLMTREVLARGALVNLVEHPAVSRRTSRWRLQVMADHTEEQINRLVDIAVAVRETVRG